MKRQEINEVTEDDTANHPKDETRSAGSSTQDNVSNNICAALAVEGERKADRDHAQQV
jgi:hypothetical protein